MTVSAPAKAAQVVSLSYDFDPLSLHARAPDRYPYLLQSVAHNPQQGRYDILFAFPEQTLWSRHGDSGFLAELDREWRRSASPGRDSPAPFGGGWFVCLTYELAQQIEPSLDLPPWDGGFTAFATRIPVALVRDHYARRAWAVAEPGHLARLTEVRKDLRSLQAYPPAPSHRRSAVLREPGAAAYLRAVADAQAYIEDGEIFQANLSREWRAAGVDTELVSLYRALRQTNPAPFAGLARWAGGGLASSSPERLLGIRDGRIFTRPIAGTRPRSSTATMDAALSEELFASGKERAEHVMLIDLERNDLGRVCAAGTVRVDEFMVRESYAHVHHIVSNVSGELRAGVSPGEAIAALFPGGTITGVPKVRCMEVISELEEGARGPYTGSIGYLDRDGSMDLNILIRTLVNTAAGLSLRAGAGIVADSVPEQELAETRAKAKGLLLATQLEEVGNHVAG